MVSGAGGGNIRPSLRCPSTTDWQFSRQSAVTFSLGSLLTNWKYPHSQNASGNDFRGPSGQALPHPSPVSLSRPFCLAPTISKHLLHRLKHEFHACKFASLTEQDIEKIVEDKDSQNTKRSTKVAKELFADYAKEKKLRKAGEKKELAQTFKTFYVEARKKEFVQCIIKGLSD